MLTFLVQILVATFAIIAATELISSSSQGSHYLGFAVLLLGARIVSRLFPPLPRAIYDGNEGNDGNMDE